MLRFTPFVISCFAILSLCSQTKADLVLNVDTAADLIYFSGSTTGNPNDTISPASAIVQFTSGFFTADQIVPLVDVETAISHNAVNVSDGLNLFFTNTGVQLNFSHSGASASQPITYNGLGSANAVSYASLLSADQAILESQIGTTLTLATGTGFDDVPIVASIAAVPEPSSAIVVCSALAVLATRRKRLRTSK